MKKLLIFVFFFASISAFSQFGFRVLHYSPMPKAPYLLGNSIGAEIGMTTFIFYNERFVGRGSVGFINHSILFKTTPGYIESFGNSEAQVSPSIQIQEKFMEFYAAIGVDFNIIDYDKVKFYIGTDILVGSFRSEAKTINALRSSEDIYDGAILGFRTKLGCSYLLTSWLEPFAEAHYSGKNYRGLSSFGGLDFGMGLKFWIDGKD